MENVYIEGINFTGNSGNLPRWASEAAMNSLSSEVKNLSKALLKSTGGSSGSSSDKLNKAQKNTIEEFENLSNTIEDFGARANAVGSSMEEFGKTAKESKGIFSSASGTVRSGLSSISNKSKGVASKFSFLKGIVGKTLPVIGALGAAISTLIGFVTKTADAMMSVFNSGVTLQRGMFQLRKAAGVAAMPLEDFSSMLVKSSAVVASLGENGAMALANITKSTRQLARSQGLYGLTMEQLTEYTGTYLETLRLQNILEKTNRAQAVNDYIKDLTLFSQVLGKSREEIAKEAQDFSERVDVFGVLQSLPEDIRKNATDTYNKAVMGIAGSFGDSSEEFNEVFADLVVNVNDYQNEFIRVLQSNNPVLADRIISFANGVRDGTVKQDQVNERLAGIISGFRNMSDEQRAFFSSQIEIGKTFSEGSKSIMGLLRQSESITEEQLERLKKGLTKNVDEEVSLIQQYRDEMRNITGSFQQFIAEVFMKNLDTVKELMGMVTERTGDLAKFVKDMLDIAIKLVDPNTREETWKKIEERISTVLNDLIDNLLESISRAIKEKINPFSRSTEQRQAQETSFSIQTSEIEKAKQNVDEDKKKKIDKLNEVLGNVIKHEDFVDDITGSDKVSALSKLMKSSNKLDVDIEKILQPIIKQDKNFREVFNKLKKVSEAGGDLQKIESINDLERKSMQASILNARRRRRAREEITEDREIRPRATPVREQQVGGIGPRTTPARNQIEASRENIRSNQELEPLRIPERDEVFNKIANGLDYLARKADESAKHQEEMVRKQGEAVKATKTTSKELKNSKNELR